MKTSDISIFAVREGDDSSITYIPDSLLIEMLTTSTHTGWPLVEKSAKLRGYIDVINLSEGSGLRYGSKVTKGVHNILGWMVSSWQHCEIYDVEDQFGDEDRNRFYLVPCELLPDEALLEVFDVVKPDDLGDFMNLRAEAQKGLSRSTKQPWLL